MEIKTLVNLQASVKDAVKLPETGRWTEGQLLKAVVQGLAEKGQISLRIGTAVLTADVNFPVRPGEKLTLQVARTGELPLLQLIRPEVRSASVEQALRTLLPKQEQLPPFLATASTLAKPENSRQLPVPVLRAVRQIISALPDATRIRQPGVLKQALQQSGNFLDAHLLQATKTGASSLSSADFQVGLLRLKQALQSTTPQGGAASAAAQGKAAAAPVTTTGSSQPTGVTSDTRSLSEQLPASAKGDRVFPDARLGQALPPADNPDPTRTLPAAAASIPPAGYNLNRQAEMNSGIAMLIKHLMPKPQARAPETPVANLQQQHILAQLLKDTESAIGRTRFNQLVSQHAETENRQVWMIELPVKKDNGFDLFQVRIQRDDKDSNGNAGKQPLWSVNMAFDLEGIGPMHVNVTLQNEVISSTMWIENPDSLTLFQDYLYELRNRLGGAGLQVSEIDLLPGSPPYTGIEISNGDQKLVDFKA